MLENYYQYTDNIKALNAQLNHLLKDKYETKITSVTSSEPKAIGKITDKVLNQVLKIESYYDIEIEKISNKLERMFNDKEIIDNALENLSHFERRIIELRLGEGERWEDVAFKMNISTRQIYNHFRAAIKELEKHVLN